MTEVEAKEAFKDRVEGTIGFNLRFVAFARDYIIAILYTFCCKCCCCCASEGRGSASCRKKASYLKRHNLASKRLHEEQDIQQVIVAGRLIRLLSRSILNARQRTTVNFS